LFPHQCWMGDRADDQVSMAMQMFEAKHRLERLLSDLRKIGDVTISHNMAVLSLIGTNMRNAIGTAGVMFTTLAQAKINIALISQGASEINISCGECCCVYVV
jgi:aspartate kinase